MDPKREEDSAGYRVDVLHVLHCYHGENFYKPTLDFTRLESLAQVTTPDQGGQTALLSETQKRLRLEVTLAVPDITSLQGENGAETEPAS